VPCCAAAYATTAPAANDALDEIDRKEGGVELPGKGGDCGRVEVSRIVGAAPGEADGASGESRSDEGVGKEIS
jgi:hypothetical protein